MEHINQGPCLFQNANTEKKRYYRGVEIMRKRTVFVFITAIAFMTNIFTTFVNKGEAISLFSQENVSGQINQGMKEIAGQSEVEVNNAKSILQELVGKISDAVDDTIKVSEITGKIFDENKTYDNLAKDEIDNIVQKLMHARDMYREVIENEKIYRKALLESRRGVEMVVKKSNALLNDVQKGVGTTVAKLESLNSKNPKTIIDQDNIEHLKGIESLLKAKTGMLEKFSREMEGISKGSDITNESVDRLLNQIKNGVELINEAADVILMTKDLNEAKKTFKSAMQINELVQKISDALRKMADNVNLVIVTANSM